MFGFGSLCTIYILSAIERDMKTTKVIKERPNTMTDNQHTEGERERDSPGSYQGELPRISSGKPS